MIELEKSVAESNVYSSMIENDEWISELKTNNVYLIEKPDLDLEDWKGLSSVYRIL